MKKIILLITSLLFFNFKTSIKAITEVDFKKASLLSTETNLNLSNLKYSKDEFETAIEFKERIKKEKKEHLKFLQTRIYKLIIPYNSSIKDKTNTPFDYISYNADNKTMDFAIKRFFFYHSTISKIRETSDLFFPFVSVHKNKVHSIIMNIDEAKKLNKNNIKIELLFSPLQTAILNKNLTVNIYNDDMYIKKSISFSNSIIGYKIYDDKKTYVEVLPNPQLDKFFIKYANYAIENNINYNNMSFFKKKNLYYFVSNNFYDEYCIEYNSKINKFKKYKIKSSYDFKEKLKKTSQAFYFF